MQNRRQMHLQTGRRRTVRTEEPVQEIPEDTPSEDDTWEETGTENGQEILYPAEDPGIYEEYTEYGEGDEAGSEAVGTIPPAPRTAHGQRSRRPALQKRVRRERNRTRTAMTRNYPIRRKQRQTMVPAPLISVRLSPAPRTASRADASQ